MQKREMDTREGVDFGGKEKGREKITKEVGKKTVGAIDFS